MNLLYSLAWTHNTKKYCNIVFNFQAAALHLSALLEMNSDGRKDNLRGIDDKLSVTRNGLGSTNDDHLLFRFLNEKSIRNMRTPLQLALFVSPLSLFSKAAKPA